MAKHTIEALEALRKERRLTKSEAAALRYLQDPETARARLREWRQANPEKTAAQAARARQNKLKIDPDFERRNIQRWRERHPEDVENRMIAYWTNTEVYRERSRASQRAHPETVRHGCRKRRARKKNAPGSHTRQEVETLFDAQLAICANPYCRCTLTTDTRHLDHRKPLCKGGSDSIENLQWLCRSCNSRKGSFDELVWLTREAKRAALVLQTGASACIDKGLQPLPRGPSTRLSGVREKEDRALVF